MNGFPDIYLKDAEINNPTLSSPNCPFDLPFYQSRDTLTDVELYRAFVENSLTRFRHSIFYKHYVGYLNDLGLDHCQFHGYIQKGMATIEMHHNMLTVYDIAIILTEYTLKTVGFISTFDLVQMLKHVHRENLVQLVMLSLTPHQLYHNTDQFFIHPDMCFGFWQEFLKQYGIGLTENITKKILYCLDKALEFGTSDDGGLLDLRNQILDWSHLNN